MFRPQSLAVAAGVRHLASRNRVEMRRAEQLSVLDGALHDAVVTMNRTLVPGSLRGRRRGLAAVLVEAASSLAAERGWRVVPACSYAAAWAKRHAPVRSPQA